MDPDDLLHNQQLLQTYRAVLRELERQAATLGPLTPPAITLQIDDYRTKIAEIEPQVNTPWPRHNLPPRDYEQFVGRQKELGQLAQLLAPRSRAYVVTVDGIGGIGKSALALEVAHGFHERYADLPAAERFDAIVWVSAKQAHLRPGALLRQRQPFQGLDELFAAIARVHGQAFGAGLTPEQRRERAERLLAQRRTLLVLDNLETVDDEELLLFLRMLPEPTKAIVTTRHRVDVAYPIRLTGMPDADALALVGQEAARCGVTLAEDERAELVRRTGGVPLAIVWSVGLLAMGETVRLVLRRLSQGQNDIARFCFDSSVAAIRGQPAHTLLLALALFEGDAGRELLGRVAGLADDDLARDEGLATLQRLSLVNKDADRFGLLPLTRGYALTDLAQRPDEERALRERWIACLAELAQPFAQPYWLRPDRGVLRRDGAHLATLAGWARANDRLDVLLRIVPGLTNYYDLTGQWGETLKVAPAALEYAKLVGDKLSAVFVETYMLSWILRQLGRIDEAEQYIADALTAARQLDDVAWQCEVLIRYSQALRYRQAFDQALARCQEAQQLAAGTPHTILRADIEYELGKLARDQARWEDARAHLEASRALFGHQPDNPTHNVELAWGVWSNLGFVMQQLGRLDAAADLYREALIFAKERGGRGNLITFQIRLALLEQERGNSALALDYAREALAWSRQLGMVKELALAEKLVEKLAPGAKP